MVFQSLPKMVLANDASTIAIAMTGVVFATLILAYRRTTQHGESIGSTSSQTSKKRRQRPKKQKGIELCPSGETDDSKLAQREPIVVGTRCWHRSSSCEVVVIKVYYDDPPPYYSVRFADGTERNTIRARLDTLEERAAEEAAQREVEAESRAAAAAAALLAEEEAEAAASCTKKRPASQRKARR